MIRRLAALGTSLAIIGGGLLGLAAPASAASVTIDCENDSQSVSVAVDDTLVISAAHCTIQSVAGVGAFSPASGYIPSSVTFTSSVAGTAVITVYGAGVNPTVLTINVGASAGTTDPALVYPTAYVNPNGGTCTGTLQFTKHNGQHGTVTTPTSDTCSRPNYTLVGWSTTADSRDAIWQPGATVPIGDESFTLFAVWSANGLQITYDANVGMDAQCLANSVNAATREERRSTIVLGALASGAPVRLEGNGYVRWTDAVPAAPCAPAGYTLAGWSTSPTGSVRGGSGVGDIVTSADGLTPTGTAPIGSNSVTLYAVWAPELSINCTTTRGAALYTFACTDFGTVPVGYRAVLEVLVMNHSNRSVSLVASDLPSVSGLNGQLAAAPQTGDCGASVSVAGGESCTLHYAWTSSVAGPLASASVPVTVCAAGNPNQCYRTAAGQGLRGTAYEPAPVVPDTYGLAVTPISQDIAPEGAPTVNLTATRNGSAAAGAAVTYRWTGEDEYGVWDMGSQTVTTDAKGSATVAMGANVGTTGYALMTATFGDQSATARFNVVQPAVKSITITGERKKVQGKPGIAVSGSSAGFAPGDVVIPYIKFAGMTDYSETTARPEIGADGSFFWERKTGKKVYVYVRTADGSIESNRVIIPAL